MPATAVSIGKPARPLLRFGTLPGEPFSSLQVRLRDGVSAGPKPLLFGYTNGYLGYLVADAAAATVEKLGGALDRTVTAIEPYLMQLQLEQQTS